MGGETSQTTEETIPIAIEEDREATRRLIVWLAFGQFNLFVFAALGAMVIKGWEVSPATSNYMTMVLQAEIALLASVGAFYLMLSQGQKKTSSDSVTVPTGTQSTVTTEVKPAEPKPQGGV